MNQFHALTIDVEDYFQVSAFEPFIARESWHDYESRVLPNTRRILEMLSEHGVKATFFVLGWIAEHHPQVVREIQAGGHEIGSHGYWHRLIYAQSPQEFRDDLRRAAGVLESLTGQPPRAYRAPSFSITRQSLWALDILAEEGYDTDSSIFPVRHDRYGIPDAPPRFHRRAVASGDLWECPPSVLPIGRWNLPVGGGGYLRLYPHWWTAHALKRLERAGVPAVVYVHPWELDPAQPRLPIPSRLARFRHYVSLSSTQGKLERLLRQFRFGRLCDVLHAYRANHADVPAQVGTK